MALNIHTDPRFEKYLEWLSRQSKKTKTDVIKELVYERYRLKKSGFRFGALSSAGKDASENIQKELEEMDKDRDLG